MLPHVSWTFAWTKVSLLEAHNFLSRVIEIKKTEFITADLAHMDINYKFSNYVCDNAYMGSQIKYWPNSLLVFAKNIYCANRCAKAVV